MYMDHDKRLLALVDDSPESDRALRYIGDLLQGTSGFTVILLHMLGPLPARLKESRGAETPRGEERVEAALAEKQDQFLRKSVAEARPLLERAKAILVGAGVPAEAIQQDCPELANSEDFVADVLHEARSRACATVVVGRQSFNGLRKFFVDQTADDLIQAGQRLAFWVIQ
jgi:nucleotide-binding universal stress UspA family protein